MLKIGECQGYIDEDCVNCGRHRVEHYSKGLDICEKCRWCKQLNRYMSDDEIYEEEDYTWKTAEVNLITEQIKPNLSELLSELKGGNNE